VITITLPIKTISEANSVPASRREAVAKWARTKHQRKNTSDYLYSCKDLWFGHWADALGAGKGPIVVTLTRCAHGNRKIDKGSLGAALKAVQDGVADACGIDDGNEQVYDWQYKQERLPQGEFAVKIQFDLPTDREQSYGHFRQPIPPKKQKHGDSPLFRSAKMFRPSRKLKTYKKSS
jgi:hypothetical protein